MRQHTKATLRFFWKHAMRYKYMVLGVMLSLMIFISAAMALPFMYRDFFNALSSDTSREVIFGQLLTTIYFILAIEMIEWVFFRCAHFLNNLFAARTQADITNECFEYLHGHSYNFFSNNFTGALVKRVSRMSRAFDGISNKIFWDFIPLLLRSVIALVVLFTLHTVLGISMLIWMALFLVVNYYLSFYKLKFDLEKSSADTEVTASLADTITNNANVKLFAGLSFELRKFREITGDWSRKSKKSWDTGAIIEAVQALLMVAVNFLILFFAARLWRSGILGVGDFVLIQAYLLDIFRHVWDFGRVIRDTYEQFAEAEEMTIILNTPHGVQNLKPVRSLNIFDGKVEFEKVTFGYDRREGVIQDLSFRIKPSEKIALIGPSGGGKTTVVKLLLRLYDVNGGRIFIDGQDISHVSQDSLHEQVAMVPQDPILFHRTLMENIRYGRRNASDEEVVAASKMAHCHEFISKLPEGYGTYVGERGVKLSGGERQRVAIARAILSNAHILILDEATSQLDSESEMFIQDALLNLMKNKTSIVIAHRLSTIMKMDRVLVFQDGRIIEEGTHAQLVSQTGSLYRRLWNLQAGGYLEV